MNRLSHDFIYHSPECLKARNTLDLLVLIARDDRVETLRDLLYITNEAEREYSRLAQFRS